MARSDFDLIDFLPYLLNQAAEKSSLGFQAYYKGTYGFLRTEWRVLFHLGRYGEMTAVEIGARAMIHKTKISRAVARLTERRFLTRREDMADRRREVLSLTPLGRKAFEDLCEKAAVYDRDCVAGLSEEEQRVLRAALRHLANIPRD
ncbi:MAG: MarR family transcriptional regulator [Litoreibacter sp.]|nr:MarR family transcriptional regulator [Litoreibacter sp.]